MTRLLDKKTASAKIECLCSVGGYQLCVSFQTANISSFQLIQQQQREESASGSQGELSTKGRIEYMELGTECKGVHRKSLAKIECLRDIGILVVLTADGLVQFLDVNTLSLLVSSVLNQVKGASDIAVVQGIEMVKTIPVLFARLAIITQRKKLLVFEWKETEFSFFKVSTAMRMHDLMGFMVVLGIGALCAGQDSLHALVKVWEITRPGCGERVCVCGAVESGVGP